MLRNRRVRGVYLIAVLTYLTEACPRLNRDDLQGSTLLYVAYPRRPKAIFTRKNQPRFISNIPFERNRGFFPCWDVKPLCQVGLFVEQPHHLGGSGKDTFTRGR